MHKNLILLDLELLILLDKFKSLIILLSLTDMLIYDNFNSDSDYIDNNLISDTGSAIRQELKKLTILLRTRTQHYKTFNIIINIVFNKKELSNKIINVSITLLLTL